jgi:hypothetical protein
MAWLCTPSIIPDHGMSVPQSCCKYMLPGYNTSVSPQHLADCMRYNKPLNVQARARARARAHTHTHTHTHTHPHPQGGAREGGTGSEFLRIHTVVPVVALVGRD